MTPAMGSAYPDGRQGWYAATVLAVLYALSNVDRQVFGLLIEPIREDLDVSDTMMGVLGGFAFAVFYTIMGLPIARIADTASRRMVILFGVIVWSIATVSCGLTRTVTQLFIARVGVSAGEAALSPAAYSLLSDYFPPNKLGRAMSVYVLGAAFGYGLAYLAGGALFGYFSSIEPIVAPIIGEIKPWQATFIAVGAPGIVLAFLMTTVREPERRIGAKAASASGDVSGLMPFLWRRRSVLSSLIIATSGYSIASSAFNMWMPAHFVRAYGWSLAQVGFAFGGLLLTLGVVGVLAAGFLADKLKGPGGRAEQYFKLMAWWSLAAAPVLSFGSLMPNGAAALAVLAPAVLLAMGPPVLAPALIQIVTPNRVRAQVSAIYLFVVSLLGMGLGPLLVGVTNDKVFAGADRLGWSITCVCGAGMVVAFVGFFIGIGLARRLESDAPDSLLTSQSATGAA